MAELTVFSYRSGKSLLHELDVRFKILFLMGISIASLHASPRALALLSAAVVALGISIRLSARTLAHEIRYFLILLVLVFIARSFATPGDPLFEWGSVTVTHQGIRSGVLVCWRLLLIVLMGLLYMASTRPSEIRVGIEWFLRPLPGIPQRKVGTMIGLIVRFVPVILIQARETADAQRARGVENRKNPIYRLVKLSFPLMRRIFLNADRLAVAMEARCYGENRAESDLTVSWRDWTASGAVAFLCLLLIAA